MYCTIDFFRKASEFLYFPSITEQKAKVSEVMADTQVTDYLLHAGIWLLTIASAILIIYLLLKTIFWLTEKVFKLESGVMSYWIWKRLTNHLAKAMGIVWICGFVMYCTGTWVPTGDSPWSVVPMAMIHATEMFAFQSDISAIHPAQHNSPLYMMCFNVCHFAAMACSLVFIFRYVGFFIKESFRLFLRSLWAELFNRWIPKNKVYVFWGLNEQTFLLAESIRQKMKEDKSAKGHIIIVRTFDDDESQTSRMGFSRMFNVIRMKDHEIERLRHKSYYITHTTHELAKHSDSNGNFSVLRDEMRLGRLVSIMRHAENVSVFFIGDDEVSNIKRTRNFCNDIRQWQGSCNFKVYCHARSGGINRVLEQEKFGQNISVEVIDSSHLAVEQLKKIPLTLPVNYVKVEEDATVSSPFNAMVIGFGEVGMDAVRFLYEYASFAKSGSTADKVTRAPFHCDIVDCDMDKVSGKFTSKIAGISMESQKRHDPQPELTFHSMDTIDYEFYELVKARIKTLNYVVISYNDDEQSMNVAVEILKIAIQERKNLDNFIILVRNYDFTLYKYMQNIAYHFNRIVHADENINLDCTAHNHNTVHYDEQTETPIFLFGKLDELFSYDSIIDETHINEAKRYYDKYNSCFPEGETLKWDERIAKLLMWNHDISPNYTDILELRRMCSQDVTNSMHAKTKLLLFEHALGKSELDRCAQLRVRKELDRPQKSISYTGDPGAALIKVIDTLAWTEHLRWNAAHMMLGYKDGEKKDRTRQIHNCIKDWQDLSTPGDENSKIRTQSYDYNVVDVSLILYAENQDKTNDRPAF